MTPQPIPATHTIDEPRRVYTWFLCRLWTRRWWTI